MTAVRAAMAVRAPSLVLRGHVLAQDHEVVALSLHGRLPHTQRAYRADADRLLAYVGRPLREVTLGDLQAFANTLDGKPATRARTISSVKSLLSFGHRLGYLPLNAGAPLKLPKAKNTLAERILDEQSVQRLLALEPKPRNQVLLRLAYASGARVAELAALRWRDVQPRAGGAGQIVLVGKGDTTRTVLLGASVFGALLTLRGSAGQDAPVFAGRHGRPMGVSTMRLIVYAAARRARLEERHVSPQWLRHAHASHALDRGAPVRLGQATLGHASLATTSRYTHARPTDSSALYLAI